MIFTMSAKIFCFYKQHIRHLQILCYKKKQYFCNFLLAWWCRCNEKLYIYFITIETLIFEILINLLKNRVNLQQS